MRCTPLILLISVLILEFGVQGKVFMRCELAKKLLDYNINKSYLSNWICLVEHESSGDTRKQTRKENGIINYGLFQIDNKNACQVGKRGGWCNKKCEDFLDDNITDDVECADEIFKRDGFKHWQGWRTFCRNTQNLPNLKVTCNVDNLTKRSTSPFTG